ncbi:MAG: S8 family serine peptidase [Saprospiraceae bacterium]|nr:S8 family serine peptidase [Saprospiraceae bacterium]
MHLYRPFLLIVLALLLPLGSFGQKTDHLLGEVLVMLTEGTEPTAWAEKWQRFEGRHTQFAPHRRVSAPMRIWAFRFDFNRIHEYRFLESLRRDEDVVMAQFNHFIKLRAVPDDPQFSEQWQLQNLGQTGSTPGNDLGVVEAWDITTGGLTPAGDTIVVCVIDNGQDPVHEDYGDNIWINHAEIPGNGIDDDQNGFVDDYRGWNSFQDDDDIDDLNWHGTPVSGIIGARGNNGLGVAGINWEVKIMTVVGGSGLESEVLESYSYPLVHRKRYNETKGAEGAFVVATNASWGADFSFPEDAPLWCAFYDSLGTHGILNVGAASNEDVDVDIEGDLPTTCPSPFLIGVTNLNQRNQKLEQAAFGSQSVDLGAYGEDVWTTADNNGYDAFGGTSAATPQVTGAIALLYSAPCEGFIALAKSDPAAAALAVRSHILNGTVPTASLEGVTVTGGRLHIGNSLDLLLNNCSDCQPPSSLRVEDLTGTSVQLAWNQNDSIQTVDLRWRALGADTWNEVTSAEAPYALSNLNPCNSYEFQLRAHCRSESTGYTPSFEFQTDGCCEAPEEVSIAISGGDNAFLDWNTVLAADIYNLRWRQLGSSTWSEISSRPTFFLLDELEDCTEYELQLQSVCEGEASGFSSSFNFMTKDCGACLDQSYCDPENTTGTEEYIASVRLHTLENISGPDGGYGNYTGLTAPQLVVGSAYQIELEPGFQSDDAFGEYFRVWIDFDQDGGFERSEMVFDAGEPSETEVSGTVSIPPTAVLGNTRMRVVMQFQSPGSPCSLSGLGFGEIEDYCVAIVREGEVCDIPTQLDTSLVLVDQAELHWESEAANSYLFRFRESTTNSWESIGSEEKRIILENLQPCVEYEAQVQAICGEDIASDFSASLFFTTSCSTTTEEAHGGPNLIQLSPNPFSNEINLRFSRDGGDSDGMELIIFDLTGRTRHAQVINGYATNGLFIDLSFLPDGLYLLQLRDRNGRFETHRIVKTGQ